MLKIKARAVCTVPFLGAWIGKSTLLQLITDNITYDGSTYEIMSAGLVIPGWLCDCGSAITDRVCPILTNSGCERVLGMVNAAAQLASHGATCLAEFIGHRRSWTAEEPRAL